MEKQYISDYDVRLATLAKMGGDASKNYASVYDIDIEILKLTGQGGGGTTPEQVREIVESYDYTTMADVEAKDYATEGWVEEKIAEIPAGAKEVELVKDDYITAEEYNGIMDLSIKPYTMNSTYGKMYGTVNPSKGQVHFNHISAKNSYTQLGATITYFSFTDMGSVYQCKSNTKLSATYDPLTKDQFATINGQSITNGGDIEIQGGSLNVLTFDMVQSSGSQYRVYYTDEEDGEYKPMSYSKMLELIKDPSNIVRVKDTNRDNGYVYDGRISRNYYGNEYITFYTTSHNGQSSFTSSGSSFYSFYYGMYFDYSMLSNYLQTRSLTQAEYDALETKDDHTLYIITDATE